MGCTRARDIKLSCGKTSLLYRRSVSDTGHLLWNKQEVFICFAHFCSSSCTAAQIQASTTWNRLIYEGSYITLNNITVFYDKPKRNQFACETQYVPDVHTRNMNPWCLCSCLDLFVEWMKDLRYIYRPTGLIKCIGSSEFRADFSTHWTNK